MGKWQKEYEELISHSQYDLDFIGKVNDVLDKYGAELDADTGINCITLKATAYVRLNLFSDAVREVESLKASDYSDPRLTTAGLLLSESLINLGMTERALDVATSIASGLPKEMIFQRLAAVKLIIEATDAKVSDQTVIQWINELYDFFGFENKQDPVHSFHTFYHQHRVSNRNYSMLLAQVRSWSTVQRNEFVDRYTAQEPLDYYRKKAELLRGKD